MVAEKRALVAPAATFNDDLKETAELLPVRFTVNPPLAAAALNVIAHASVRDRLSAKSSQRVIAETLLEALPELAAVVSTGMFARWMD